MQLASEDHGQAANSSTDPCQYNSNSEGSGCWVLFTKQTIVDYVLIISFTKVRRLSHINIPSPSFLRASFYIEGYTSCVYIHLHCSHLMELAGDGRLARRSIHWRRFLRRSHSWHRTSRSHLRKFLGTPIYPTHEFLMSTPIEP